MVVVVFLSSCFPRLRKGRAVGFLAGTFKRARATVIKRQDRKWGADFFYTFMDFFGSFPLEPLNFLGSFINPVHFKVILMCISFCYMWHLSLFTPLLL